jgi:hypothetical protein
MVDKDQKKFAANAVSKMAPSVRRVLYFLNSREIVNFLEKLSGILLAVSTRSPPLLRFTFVEKLRRTQVRNGGTRPDELQWLRLRTMRCFDSRER